MTPPPQERLQEEIINFRQLHEALGLTRDEIVQEIAEQIEKNELAARQFTISSPRIDLVRRAKFAMLPVNRFLTRKLEDVGKFNVSVNVVIRREIAEDVADLVVKSEDDFKSLEKRGKVK